MSREQAKANAELIRRMAASFEALRCEMEATEARAIELIDRANRIDEELASMLGQSTDCELGQVTRMREQLNRNRAALALSEGKQP